MLLAWTPLLTICVTSFITDATLEYRSFLPGCCGKNTGGKQASSCYAPWQLTRTTFWPPPSTMPTVAALDFTHCTLGGPLWDMWRCWQFHPENGAPHRWDVCGIFAPILLTVCSGKRWFPGYRECADSVSVRQGGLIHRKRVHSGKTATGYPGYFCASATYPSCRWASKSVM